MGFLLFLAVLVFAVAVDFGLAALVAWAVTAFTALPFWPVAVIAFVVILVLGIATAN